MEDVTTITVQKSTRDRLNNVGKKNQTYDELIKQLVDFYQRYHGVVNA